MGIAIMKGEWAIYLMSLVFLLLLCVSCSDAAASGEGDNTDDVTNNAAVDGNAGDASQVVTFPGSGTAGAGDPLEPGVGPETADECGTGTPSDGDIEVIDQAAMCFYSADDPSSPAASMEQIVEIVDDVEYVHLRLTLDPHFVDNSYGVNSIGWGKRGHTFRDLYGSDHAEMVMYDADGNLVLQFKVDYLTLDESGDSPSGYGSLGVTGGDGKMIVGDASSILGTATSLDRNLNGCGFVEYTEDSPPTDDSYTPSADAPEWDYRVVYEVWVDAAAFGDAGFGEAIIEYVHASPSKEENDTQEVTPGPCPPCDPNVEECDPWRYDEEPCDPNVEECDGYEEEEEPCDPNVEECEGYEEPPCDPETENCDPIVV